MSLQKTWLTGITMVLMAASIQASAQTVDVRFSVAEKKIIAEYFDEERNDKNGHAAQRHKHKGKSKRLPPGIAKNLQRGKPLPPGIAKRGLPADLKSRLPRAPKGYERIIVAGKVLLVEIATQVVRDVLEDALF